MLLWWFSPRCPFWSIQ